LQWGIFFVFRYLTFQFRKENVSNLHRLLEDMGDFILLYFLQILPVSQIRSYYRYHHFRMSSQADFHFEGYKVIFVQG